LSEDKVSEAKQVFQRHSDMLTDLPGEGNLCDHAIHLTTDKPVNVKQYPLPFGTQDVMAQEVSKMLEMDIIEPSTSPYASPVVLVKKKDGSVRFCIDFRQLNAVTRFDAEPIPDVEDMFSSLSDKQWFTKVDLTKGYWQIKMAEADKEKTAFRTPQGLFQFKRMPFGLSTAPSTFARMMRMLDLERFHAMNFFDDILIATCDWTTHLRSIDALLSELSKHGLTARPSKIDVGFREIEFLGHVIGNEQMRPEKSKISRILSVSVPTTKKQVRAFLGLAGFYRRYIPNYASLVAPLTDLTKGFCPNKVKWTSECQTAFDCIKQSLSSDPVVALPDFSKTFTVRTDASSVGIGAVLMQPDSHGHLHPILYASRKLLERETRYSTIERECLALVWAVEKFQRYLYGRHFIVETDHKPLTVLKKSTKTNNRILRWALTLQDFSFSVMPIPGSRNFEADVLSRLVE
jgi:hypothetical protein